MRDVAKKQQQFFAGMILSIVRVVQVCLNVFVIWWD
jgi:hypothetical protein